IGVRYGDQVAQDMIAVRISPDIRMAMVAAPSYLDGRKPPETRIQEVASGPIEWCFDDDSLDEIQHYMADAQLRRLPVVDHDKRLVGMLSLADIATRTASPERDDVANTLEGVSQPKQT
ncbi:CBS domain-containing protein, partial [Burkholderia sp. KCJ3K979]|uniref:CBS domain-containing protein n=1 Tax=Burkholderia sp. KCJ3K979 TaxID=2759149 RepID=UPI001F39ADEE